MVIVRPLTPADAPAYAALRREMLADAPWAFGSSLEDDARLDPAVVAARLSEPWQAIVGGFDEAGRLVGAAGVFKAHHVKSAHRAHVWGMYVSPSARGRGLGEAILRAALGIARTWPGVTSVLLSVSVRAAAARRLYERMGFRAWGIEPAALVVDGVAVDEAHMVLFFES